MELRVPEGSPIAVDGIMELEEWAGALAVEIGERATLRLKHADGFLFIGLETQEPVVGNVLLQAGDILSILHSSAALGTALYVRSDGLWQRTKDFVWQCRSRTLTDSAIRQRNAFLEEEGWMASITYMGAGNHLEYRIADAATIERLALVLLPASHPEDAFTWPEELTQDLFPGPIGAIATIDSREWASLNLKSG